MQLLITLMSMAGMTFLAVLKILYQFSISLRYEVSICYFLNSGKWVVLCSAHTDCIVTEDHSSAETFLQHVDRYDS